MVALFFSIKSPAVFSDTSYIINQVVQEVNPHSVNIFFSYSVIKNNSSSSEIAKICDNSSKIIYSYESISREKKVNATNDQISPVYSNQPTLESLIIFHTSDLLEVQGFIDYLVRSLSMVRQRPTCLIIFHNNFDSEQKIIIENILKYAWDRYFLDFSLADAHEINSSSTIIYDFNPFYNLTNLRNFSADTKIFPDKLLNVNKYPFYMSYQESKLTVLYVKMPKGKIRFSFNQQHQLNFILRVMRFSKVYDKTIHFEDQTLRLSDNFKKAKLDIYDQEIVSPDYSKKLIVPIGQKTEKLVALVPIIHIALQTSTSSAVFCCVLIFIGILMILVTLMKHFRFKILKKVKAFDVVRLFLAQPIRWKPLILVDQRIYITMTLAFVKFMNDFYINLIKVKMGIEEIPFENYKNWLNFQLHLQHSNFKNFKVDDPDLEMVLKNSVVISKNVSCMVLSEDLATYFISFTTENFNGRPVMKLAEPELIQGVSTYWTFKNASPFASKFEEKNLRLQEGQLLHVPCS